jgi:hypothetical protein
MVLAFDIWMEGRPDRDEPLEGHKLFAPFRLRLCGLDRERPAHQPVQELQILSHVLPFLVTYWIGIRLDDEVAPHLHHGQPRPQLSLPASLCPRLDYRVPQPDRVLGVLQDTEVPVEVRVESLYRPGEGLAGPLDPQREGRHPVGRRDVTFTQPGLPMGFLKILAISQICPITERGIFHSQPFLFMLCRWDVRAYDIGLLLASLDYV